MLLANKDAPTCGETDRAYVGAKVWGAFSPPPVLPTLQRDKEKRNEGSAIPSLSGTFLKLEKDSPSPGIFYFRLSETSVMNTHVCDA